MKQTRREENNLLLVVSSCKVDVPNVIIHLNCTSIYLIGVWLDTWLQGWLHKKACV